MTVEKRLKRIVEKKFPDGGLCYRLKKAAQEAQKARYNKLIKELEGLGPDLIEAKIKQWESEL